MTGLVLRLAATELCGDSLRMSSVMTGLVLRLTATELHGDSL